MTTTRFPPALVDALLGNSAVALVGSGASVRAKLPSWEQLLRRLIAECKNNVSSFDENDEEELLRLLEDHQWLEVAEACRSFLRPNFYRDVLTSVLGLNNLDTTQLHRLLMELPFRAILTTNYDTLIEQAFSRSGNGIIPTFTHQDRAELAKATRSTSKFLLKLHGDIRRVESIVLTADDYDLLLANPGYRTAITTLIGSSTLVILGYGFRDPDLNLVLRGYSAAFKGFGGPHFAFLANTGAILRRSLEAQFDVQVIDYDPKDDHSELEQHLSDLQSVIADERARRAIGDMMAHERNVCEELQTDIPLERARLLRERAVNAELSTDDKSLIARSIKHGDEREHEVRELEAHSRRLQNMEVAERLSGSVAHSFNDQLTVILGRSGFLSDGLRALPNSPEIEGLRQHVTEIKQAAERAANITRRLQPFTQDTTRRQDLNELVRRVIDDRTNTLPDRIDLELAIAAEPQWVYVNPTQIEAVLKDLVDNSQEAMSDGGVLRIVTEPVIVAHGSTQPKGLPPGSYATLSIIDNGVGIEAAVLERIFEPFVTTKGRQGLGLSMAYRVVKDNGGYIVLNSSPGVETRVVLYLPLSDDSSIAAVRAADLGTRFVTILLVEDNENVRDTLTELLRSEGWKVTKVTSAFEAIGIVEAPEERRVDVVLTDLSLRGMSGLELAKRLNRTASHLTLLLISGDRERLATLTDEERELFNHPPLEKPISRNELSNAIREALSRGRPRRTR